MVQQILTSVATMAAGVLIVSAADAQQTRPPGDMMQQCRQQYQATDASVDQMMKMMRDAERSNDPATMRQALQEAQKQLRETPQRMSSCLSMMDMMWQMHGSAQGRTMMGGGPESTAGTSGMQGPQPGPGMGMPSGMACCMPGAGINRAAGAALVWIGALLGLSLAAALVALTVFLWTRSRADRVRPA